ncbi:hypothetical protein QL285_097187 [Trifolium repens]|jgi:hypothetical protein|nr:hypothetical protein QL285_097187 [Trifolium repens]
MVIRNNNDKTLVTSRVEHQRNLSAITEPVITGVVDIPLLSHSTSSSTRTMPMSNGGEVVRGTRQNSPMLTEIVQAEATTMEVHTEKKRRRVEGMTLADTKEQTNQHFLSAGPGSS